MPIDHACLQVPFSRVKEEIAFILAALAPLNYKLFKEPYPGIAGIGDNMPFLWLIGMDNDHKPFQDDNPAPRSHIAFAAGSREQVDAFHKAALEAGGTDNGKPGLRTIYHPNYYAAFVLDPCGNNIEVVYHRPT